MPAQPSGTVTLVFTDIEGSTRLLHELGQDAYRQALAEHRRVLREAFGRHSGYEIDNQGDSFFYAFSSARDALSAVEEAMTGFEAGPIRIRVGVHTGEPVLDPPKYVGVDVHRAARIMAAGHGGQVLLSQATHDLVDREVTDLGEHRLKDLSAPQRLFQFGEGEFPPLRTLYRTNLPIPATRFLGRERELAELTHLVDSSDTRLLTLTGPGGIGKTRLALQAVGEAADAYPDGVFWVALAPLRDPNLLLDTVSTALDTKAGVAEYIADKRMLLLLDNFEQIVDAAPRLAELLSACPNLTLVVTSREALRLAAEQEYPVPTLTAPDGVELFTARARATRPDFTPVPAVAELCRRLDDLPLAIELAAARTKLLTAEELLDRLSERLDLLKAGRDADPRQLTLRATIQWSYDLLTEPEQRLFARLSVFAGGCTLDAAEQVVQADLETLEALIDKSLLRRTDDRFWMLETIREYAADRLDNETRLRHAEWFLALAEEAEPELIGAAQAAWLGRLDAEHDNLRAALAFLRRSGRSALEVRLAGALWWFWYSRGFLHEGRSRLEEILAATGGDHGVDHERILYGAAVLTHRLGDYDRAEQLAAERLAISRARGDPKLIASSLLALGLMAQSKGEDERALALYAEGAELARKHGDKPVLAMTLGNVGMVALEMGDEETAGSRFEEALALFREISDLRNIAGTLVNLGELARMQGQIDEGKALASEALGLAHSLEDKEVIIWCLQCLSEHAAAEGKADRAARLLGAVDALREDTGHARMPDEQRQLERITALLGTQFDEEQLAAARAEGHAMTLDEAVAYALEDS